MYWVGNNILDVVDLIQSGINLQQIPTLYYGYPLGNSQLLDVWWMEDLKIRLIHRRLVASAMNPSGKRGNN